MELEFEIQEEYPDHHYRTEIPNIVFEMNLLPECLAVYCHLKKIAGDKGSCWMSMKNLCKRIGIGETSLRRIINNMSLDSNIHIGEFILHKPLIKVTERFKEDGSRDTNLIRINSLWRENGNYFRSKIIVKGTSPNEGGVPRQTRGGTSPNEDKEEPKEEKHNFKKQQQPVAVFSEKKIYECLKPIQIPDRDKEEISEKYQEKEVDHAIKWCTRPGFTPKETLQQAIKWACKTQPEFPKEKEADPIEYEPLHRGYWRDISSGLFKEIGYCPLKDCGEYIEAKNDRIYFKDAGFLNRIENCCRKLNVSCENLYAFLSYCKKKLSEELKA